MVTSQPEAFGCQNDVIDGKFVFLKQGNDWDIESSIFNSIALGRNRQGLFEFNVSNLRKLSHF
ncbi:MAG: hypothetical protein NT027_15620 [Proteobacteria bacterium]|nr:hypothetical protein [Pseudomonadota bacterium]